MHWNYVSWETLGDLSTNLVQDMCYALEIAKICKYTASFYNYNKKLMITPISAPLSMKGVNLERGNIMKCWFQLIHCLKFYSVRYKQKSHMRESCKLMCGSYGNHVMHCIRCFSWIFSINCINVHLIVQSAAIVWCIRYMYLLHIGTIGKILMFSFQWYLKFRLFFYWHMTDFVSVSLHLIQILIFQSNIENWKLHTNNSAVVKMKISLDF